MWRDGKHKVRREQWPSHKKDSQTGGLLPSIKTAYVNWWTAAGASELWKIQLWAEPRASGRMNTLSRGEHRDCFSNFCLKTLPLVVFNSTVLCRNSLSLIWLLNGGEMYLLHECTEKRKKRHCRIAGRNSASGCLFGQIYHKHAHTHIQCWVLLATL